MIDVMEATLLYDKAILRRAAYAYLRGKLGRGYWLSFGVVGFIALPAFALVGVAGWFIAVLATLCAIGVLFGFYGFWLARRGADAAFGKLQPPRAHVVLGDEAFTVTTNQGTSTLKWSVITELRRERDYTMLFYGEDSFSVLPASGAPAGFHDSLAARVRAAGGKVR